MLFPKGNILLSPLPSQNLTVAQGCGVWLLAATAEHLLPYLLLLTVRGRASTFLSRAVSISEPWRAGAAR